MALLSHLYSVVEWIEGRMLVVYTTYYNKDNLAGKIYALMYTYSVIAWKVNRVYNTCIKCIIHATNFQISWESGFHVADRWIVADNLYYQLACSCDFVVQVFSFLCFFTFNFSSLTSLRILLGCNKRGSMAAAKISQIGRAVVMEEVWLFLEDWSWFMRGKNSIYICHYL